MGLKIPQMIRRYLRTLRYSNHYPILLPHFETTADGLRSIDGAVQQLPARLIAALKMCDGKRPLRTISRDSGTARHEIIELHDEGRIVLWPWSLPDVEPERESPTRFIVSPHPDDAALSTFACMNEGIYTDVTVINIFSRAVWWRFAEQPGVAEMVTRIREAEERLVAALTDVQFIMQGLPEALLRGYGMDDVFGSLVPERDAEVRSLIASSIDELAVANPGAWWMLPLAIGNHVDHLIVRDESLTALFRAGVPRDRIRFYEDLPYAEDAAPAAEFSELITGLRLAPAEVWPTGERKFECLRVYWSQLVWSQIKKVEDYGKRLGSGRAVERYWKIAADSPAHAIRARP